MVYMGSKARVVGDIKPYIQDCIDENGVKTYIEPFVGGANVITEINCSSRVGCDKSKPLIALLKAMRNDPTLSFAPREVDFDFYKELRAAYRTGLSKYSDAFIAAAGFFASYAGRFFDGGFARSGEGSHRNHYQERFRNAQNTALKLKDIGFICCDFLASVPPSVDNAFIYCDPPYAKTKQYGYSSESFDYEVFYLWLEDLSKRHYVLVSEYNMPSNFRLVWQKPLAVSLKQDRCRATMKTECLFTPCGGLYDKWLAARCNSENFQLRG